jgi:hypothetical protein
MDESSERWLPVPGYEGYYEVSDLGRVRSLDRWIRQLSPAGNLVCHHRRGRVLRPQCAPSTTHAHVRMSRDGAAEQRFVHQLVLETFVGPRPIGLQACHGPSGARDNRLSNLRWDTPSENSFDRVRDGNNHFVNRTYCPQGHLLAKPNLRPSMAKEGHRGCWACSLTGRWAHRLGYPIASTEWATEADRRYAEILHFGRPLDYSRNPARKVYGTDRWKPPSTQCVS